MVKGDQDEKEEERLDQFSFDKSMAGAREEIETAEREAVGLRHQ